MKRVVAVINEIDQIEKVLGKAKDFVASDGLLEILFVYEEDLFELPEYFHPRFLKEDTIDKDEVKKEIEDILQKIGYSGESAIFVEISDTVSRLKHLIKDQDDLLVVNRYNEKITSRLIEEVNSLVLTLKKEPFEDKEVLYIASLDDRDKNNLNLIKKHFSDVKIRLLYDFHYYAIASADYLDPMISTPVMDIQIDQEAKKAKKALFDKLLEESGYEGEFVEEWVDEDDKLLNYIRAGEFGVVVYPKEMKHLVDRVENSTLAYSVI